MYSFCERIYEAPAGRHPAKTNKANDIHPPCL